MIVKCSDCKIVDVDITDRLKFFNGTLPQEHHVRCDKCIDIAQEKIDKINNLEKITNCATKAGLFQTQMGFFNKDIPQQIYDGFNAWKSNYYFHGSCGTGKTYSAIAMLMSAIKSHKDMCSYKFITMPDFIMKIRSSMKTGNELNDIKSLCSNRFLVLDDFGIGGDTEYCKSALYGIIDLCSRMNRKGLIITSNLSISDVSKKIDDRLASRIAGLCNVKQFNGVDRRINEK